MRGLRHHRDVPTAVGPEPLRFAKLKPDRKRRVHQAEAKRPCTRRAPPVLFNPHISTKVPRGNALRESISGIPQEMDSCSRLGRGVKAEGMRPARDASIWDRKSATLLMIVFAFFSPSGKYDSAAAGRRCQSRMLQVQNSHSACEFRNHM